MQIFAVLEFRVLLAEHPSEHLSRFQTGFYEVSVFVPMVATVAAVRPFKSDLCENAHQQFVDVVIDAHRHFDILGPVRARQIPALWKLKKNMRKGQRKNSHGYRRRTTFDF